MALNIDWAGMTMGEHEQVFAVLSAVHAHTISRIGEGIDNMPLLELGRDLNKAMHAANDDLTRREHRFERTDCDCGVCP